MGIDSYYFIAAGWGLNLSSTLGFTDMQGGEGVSRFQLTPPLSSLLHLGGSGGSASWLTSAGVRWQGNQKTSYFCCAGDGDLLPLRPADTTGTWDLKYHLYSVSRGSEISPHSFPQTPAGRGVGALLPASTGPFHSVVAVVTVVGVAAGGQFTLSPIETVGVFLLVFGWRWVLLIYFILIFYFLIFGWGRQVFGGIFF